MHRAPLVAIAVLAVSRCSRSPPPSPPAPPRVAAAVPAATAQPAPAWRAASFLRATEGCTQTWTCDCSAVAVAAGCHAVPTPDATTDGACASDSGPLNGCTRCLALPPSATCACSLACP